MTVTETEADVAVVKPKISGAVYRPHLDGLRAVAVYLVVLFHAGIDRALGGFVGVDVFFVLSGYLVTQLLLRDLVGAGGIRFSRFYSRRFRRLLPAAFVTLLVTAAVYSAVASPAEALNARGGFRASFLYSANWFFISKSQGYFGADAASNPVLHFWSLAVEEQFYLVWPLLLGGLFWATKRRADRQMLIVRAVVLVGGLASAGWAFSLRTSNPSRAYFGTDARAYQLLAGALIALTPGIAVRLVPLGRRLNLVVLAAFAALAVVASWIWHVDPIVRGIAVTVVAVVIIVSLEAAPGGAAKRLLSSGPIVYLGQISYGTYLWHWPVIVLAPRLMEMSPVSLAAVTFLLATGLASLSHQLWERPIRTSALLDRRPRAVIVAGLAISVIAGLVFIPAIVESDSGSVSAVVGDTSIGLTPIPDSVDWQTVFEDGYKTPNKCQDTKFVICTIRKGSGTHLLLMGDSNADMLVGSFIKIANREGLTLSVAIMGGCPWQRDVYGFFAGAVQRACKKAKDIAYDSGIEKLDPDVIVVMNSAGDEALILPPPGEKFSPEGRIKHLQRSTTKSVKALAVGGRDLVVIEPMPLTPIDLKAPGGNGFFRPHFNPLTCLSESRFLEACRYTSPIIPSPQELLERKLAEADENVFAADFDRLVCPFLPICDPVVAGIVVKWDGQHLARDYSESLAPKITQFLNDNNLLGG